MCCLFVGDVRAKENPILAVMHTVWLREHNRVAHQLALLNPLWTDEVLFQEARRIVTAEYQHITLNEFLPPLLGNKCFQFKHLVFFLVWASHFVFT